MGRFTQRLLLEFAEEAQVNELKPVQIVGLGDHGDDHAVITIKLPSGEEVELHFDYDGQGMLTAHHEDHEYSIPVEVDHMGEPDGDEVCPSCGCAECECTGSDEDDIDFSPEDEDGHVVSTFEGFVNECWSPIDESYSPAMSEDAKRAIKSMCEEMLIHEAKACDEDHDPMHTYESYLNECGQYMTECLMESAQKLKL